jgi:hypothetical protein
MSGSVYKAYLLEAKSEFTASLSHLEFSYHSVAELSERLDSLSESDLEKIEAFTSRFARVVDLLVHRVLRAIDRYEFNEPGTLIDVANRAESRELIQSVDWLRELKDVRNRIAHDYAGEQLIDLLKFCREAFLELSSACERTVAYIDQLA